MRFLSVFLSHTHKTYHKIVQRFAKKICRHHPTTTRCHHIATFYAPCTLIYIKCHRVKLPDAIQDNHSRIFQLFLSIFLDALVLGVLHEFVVLAICFSQMNAFEWVVASGCFPSLLLSLAFPSVLAFRDTFSSLQVSKYGTLFLVRHHCSSFFLRPIKSQRRFLPAPVSLIPWCGPTWMLRHGLRWTNGNRNPMRSRVEVVWKTYRRCPFQIMLPSSFGACQCFGWRCVFFRTSLRFGCERRWVICRIQQPSSM